MTHPLSSYIDHTLLKAEATPDDIRTLCAEAREHQFAAVCVNPVYVRLAAEQLAGSGVKVATVCGFPLGAVTPNQKAAEARQSIENGADEIDMVIHIGAARAGDWDAVQADIQAVRDATAGRVLKVIIETALLDDEQKRRATEAAVQAGADFVKTSTGFSTGGATVADVALMNEVIAGRAAIKAAGGVRSPADAQAMIDAGATRLGTSGGVGLVTSGEAGAGYY
ncbi:deoxyribose-phosphate aldolase [Deinococcus radiophilus]|uniref:Deoxyribose-phosphate aldolase n=1 Tax=Deinococcus radiophilus TaxID=32062 RepID=A0A431VQZ1_9DEIO|nr:deoxyribose-phosphate aldolase [Deinococcus radiophilus]RTR25637.1 deoxyribose-phosphate aldolase [Deinococcus radiophilus]UFA50878.1 deoxyribose-phosphate aldolase [Deinococcus radiophilus]